MHGPPLTPQEAVASIAHQVRRLEAHGLDRERAIRHAAAENDIEPEKVRWCADSALRGAEHNSASPAHDDRRHQAAHDHKPDANDTGAIPSARRRGRAAGAGRLARRTPGERRHHLNVNPATHAKGELA